MSVIDFQKSITKELEITKNRVRNLIGHANWGEEGRYKEEVLKNAIRKFLPNNVSIGTGFIRTEFDISKQIDLIVYDNTQPLLFVEGDFIIITPKSILGLIEVKSCQNLSQLRETISTLEKNIEIVKRSFINYNKKFFYGIFSFDYTAINDTNGLRETLKASKGEVNHLCLGKNKFIKLWNQEDGERLEPSIQTNHDFYNTYNLTNLSFSYFISNLIHSISENPTDMDWFSFPINGTKEVSKESTIILDNH